MKSISLGELQFLFIFSLIISVSEFWAAWLYFRYRKSVVRPSYYPAMWLTLILRGRAAMDEMRMRLLNKPKEHAIGAIIYGIGYLFICILAIAGIVLKKQNR
jgi:hypothetical protein